MSGYRRRPAGQTPGVAARMKVPCLMPHYPERNERVVGADATVLTALTGLITAACAGPPCEDRGWRREGRPGEDPGRKKEQVANTHQTNLRDDIDNLNGTCRAAVGLGVRI